MPYTFVPNLVQIGQAVLELYAKNKIQFNTIQFNKKFNSQCPPSGPPPFKQKKPFANPSSRYCARVFFSFDTRGQLALKPKFLRANFKIWGPTLKSAETIRIASNRCKF
jgi:hypothetical protein